MQGQQNQESFQAFGFNYHEMDHFDDSQELQSPLFRQALQQSGHCFQAEEKNSTFSKQIDFLAVQSFHTEQRGSLQIVPDALQHDFCAKPEEENASTLKSSETSLIFQDQDNDEEKEYKLIIKTEALTIHSSTSDMAEKFNEYCPKKSRSPTKSYRQKNQPIRQTKHLIRQLKREYKYNHIILAEISLFVEKKAVTIKSGSILPIVSEKGQLSGLIITNGDSQYKIRVINQGTSEFQPTLELWDENSQEWNEFTFKIKLLSN